jgi:glycopeptide antibiotics resistance protein
MLNFQRCHGGGLMKRLESEFQREKSIFIWSNRILTLAVAGILFLTLYPFRFPLHANPTAKMDYRFFASMRENTGLLNAFLNISLFVPFGFGLSQEFSEKGKSGATILLLTMVAGAFLSYCIEFVQIYIPPRDSGWEDVFTNAAGAMVGYFLFELVGKSILKSASEIENRFERFITLQRALWIVPLYFVAWFAGLSRYSLNLNYRTGFTIHDLWLETTLRATSIR